MPNNIQTIIDKFHKLLFYNLSGDEMEQLPVLEQFLKDSFTSMLDEIEKEAKEKQYQKTSALFDIGFNNGVQEVINIINSHR